MNMCRSCHSRPSNSKFREIKEKTTISDNGLKKSLLRTLFLDGNSDSRNYLSGRMSLYKIGMEKQFLGLSCNVVQLSSLLTVALICNRVNLWTEFQPSLLTWPFSFFDTISLALTPFFFLEEYPTRFVDINKTEQNRLFTFVLYFVCVRGDSGVSPMGKFPGSLSNLAALTP